MSKGISKGRITVDRILRSKEYKEMMGDEFEYMQQPFAHVISYELRSEYREKFNKLKEQMERDLIMFGNSKLPVNLIKGGSYELRAESSEKVLRSGIVKVNGVPMEYEREEIKESITLDSSQFDIQNASSVLKQVYNNSNIDELPEITNDYIKKTIADEFAPGFSAGLMIDEQYVRVIFNIINPLYLTLSWEEYKDHLNMINLVCTGVVDDTIQL